MYIHINTPDIMYTQTLYVHTRIYISKKRTGEVRQALGEEVDLVNVDQPYGVRTR